MLNSAPLLTLMVVGTLVPLTVIAFDTCRLDGFTLRSVMKLKGFGTALVPVPVSCTSVGEEAALLVMVSMPLRLPSLPGANVTSIVQLVALRAALQLLVCEKSPLATILLMRAPLVPVTVTLCVALGTPTVCGPNASTPGSATSVTAHDTFEVTVAVLLVSSGSVKVEELLKSALAELTTVPPQAMAGSRMPVIV